MSAARINFHTAPPGGGIWHSLNRFLFTLTVLTLLAAVGYRMMPEIGKRKEQQARVEQLKARVEVARETLARNIRVENLLKHDPEYLGILARDRFNLQKPGETIYRMEKGGTAVGVK